MARHHVIRQIDLERSAQLLAPRQRIGWRLLGHHIGAELALMHAQHRIAHADLSYLPLMQELEKRYEGKLRIQTVVSRETAAGSLTGRS